MFIGLISDTHGVLPQEVKDFLAPVDELWHAGDLGGGLEFLRSVAAFKPLRGVCGNCDGQDIRLDCPAHLEFECEGLKVLMTHIGGSPGHYDPAARKLIESYRPDIFVCGHSHILKVMSDKRYNFLYVNPGACGNQGWHVVRTALRFHLDEGKIHDMEVFNLPRH